MWATLASLLASAAGGLFLLSRTAGRSARCTSRPPTRRTCAWSRSDPHRGARRSRRGGCAPGGIRPRRGLGPDADLVPTGATYAERPRLGHAPDPDVRPQRRHHPPRDRLRHLPAARRGRHRRDGVRARGGLPDARHGGELRERVRGRRGAAPLRPAARRGRRREQDPRPPPRVRRRHRVGARLARAPRRGAHRPPPHPLAEPVARGSTSRRGARSSSSRRTAWSARSASPTSPRSTSTRIIDDTGVVPAVNQVELHPRFPQAGMREVHERLGIRTEAWSPMGKRRAPLEEARRHRGRGGARRLPRPGDPALARAARLAARSRSPPTRSGSAQNLDVFGFELARRRRWTPSAAWPRTTAGSSAATPTPTRRCDGALVRVVGMLKTTALKRAAAVAACLSVLALAGCGNESDGADTAKDPSSVEPVDVRVERARRRAARRRPASTPPTARSPRARSRPPAPRRRPRARSAPR